MSSPYDPPGPNLLESLLKLALPTGVPTAQRPEPPQGRPPSPPHLRPLPPSPGRRPEPPLGHRSGPPPGRPPSVRPPRSQAPPSDALARSSAPTSTPESDWYWPPATSKQTCYSKCCSGSVAPNRATENNQTGRVQSQYVPQIISGVVVNAVSFFLGFH